MNTFYYTLPSARLLPLALAMAAAMPALAQQAPVSSSQLETVIITATKRLQPLQQTPIAVSVIGGGGLEEANLNNMSSIVQQLPTVNFRANASNKDTALFIRGVGTISTSPGVEPTVSMVLDGVVTARAGQGTLDLAEVERIEVLRGPQGTLFGKNASAGVINVITMSPSKDPGGYIDLGWYQGGERRIRLGYGGEIVKDTVRASLSFMDAKFNGNVTNVFDGSTVNGYDRQGLRARIEITPNKDLKIGFILDRSKAADTTPTGVAYGTDVRAYPSNAVTPNPLYRAAIAPVVPSPENRQINSEIKTRVNDTNQGASMQVDYTFGDLQFTSITAYRKWKNTQFQEVDRLSFPSRNFAQLADRGDLDFNQTTQELRVASTNKQFFEYVAGLFWFDSENNEQYRRDATRCPTSSAPALPSGIVPCTPATTVLDNGVAAYGVKANSKALFGEGTWNFSPTLRAVTGLRYTADKLSYYHGRISTGTGIPGIQPTRTPVTGSTTENALTGRIGPQWNLSENMMVYTTYSRGYKGPAYNVFFSMTPLQDNRLSPEKSTSVELGLKTELLDRRLRLNLALFNAQYDGYQANVPDFINGIIISRLINAGSVSTKGVELDLTARVTPDFTVNAAVANIISRVKNFNCPPGAASSCDVNGRPLPFSPDWKASVRAKYTQSLAGNLSLDYGVDMSWQSRTNFDLQQQPDSFQKAYALVNASIALQSTAGWRLALVGKNLADQSYSSFVQSAGNNINSYVPRDVKRYFGVQFRYAL